MENCLVLFLKDNDVDIILYDIGKILSTSCIKKGIFDHHKKAFKFLVASSKIAVSLNTYMCVNILNIFNLHVHKHGNVGLLHICFYTCIKYTIHIPA